MVTYERNLVFFQDRGMGMERDLERYFDSFKTINKIEKGFSYDNKYLAVDEDGKKYVIRTADLNQQASKLKEYEMLKEAEKRGVQSSGPVDFGIIESLNICYMIVRYIEGEEALGVLPGLTVSEQYEIGFKAGLELHALHAIPAPPSPHIWYEAASAKHQRYADAYVGLDIQLEYGDRAGQFIDEHLHLLKGRPRTFQHDDFHPANLIVKDRKYAGCIDFNRHDFGDPYHDFYKVALFSREVSVPFSAGQIDGYFKGVIPHDFWALYSVYAAMSIFSAVVWTKRETPHLMDQMLSRLNMIAADHSDFDQCELEWYKTFSVKM